ncbi:conserved membrane hypothetical protein [Burkholderiales bacterium]|nr:conserved membrane hypothetical protein [Burkholderiales bacterium]
MFIGHYAPAFAARALRNSPGLATCFVAVQLVDIAFFTLAYLGVEKWRPDPGITGIMPVDLYYMPFTHSLLGSAVWALAAGAVVLVLARRGRKAIGAAIVSALVFSHWLLDLVVHRHDLGVLDDEPHKLGFGLWDRPMIEMPLEIGLVLAGFVLYAASTRARGASGRWWMWSALVVLLILQCINWFAPPPQGAVAFSGLGLFAYAVCAALAWQLERTRQSRRNPEAATAFGA